ncbi:E3 ubiquitin/ISG15 ligase TRIM25 [Erpetoichthys calabaricus]|uniref:E3 ubiquitin/ISG15 ligase TRIM25 n=1 Tax=Erpetoichthys calabaricus TaxID=27687 RepID=UPI00109F9941|nr:E3 ubiquitin/ISG15 ligase TRIM25 [Erpetoichthys calabaricus]
MGSTSSSDEPCLLCHHIARELTVFNCGHGFCRGCLQEVFGASSTATIHCPECRDQYQKMPAVGRDEVFPDSLANERHEKCTQKSPEGTVVCSYCTESSKMALKTCLVCGASMCADHLKIHTEGAAFQSHPLVDATSDISVWKCMEHQELLKIYCREDEVCVCSVCTLIGAHKQHDCISIAQAEKELRDKLKKDIQKIKTNSTIIKNNVDVLMEKKLDLQTEIIGRKSYLQDQYAMLKKLIEGEESKVLKCLEREEAKVIASIEAQLKPLQETLKDIMENSIVLEKLSDSNAATRLRDQAFVQEYCKMAKSINHMASPINELQPPRELDRDKLERLQNWTKKRLEVAPMKEEDRESLILFYGKTPNLDPDSAHVKLILTDDNQSVTHTEENQPYSHHNARFDIFPQVLGAEPLEGGCSYWEVKLQGEGRWKVGICYPQIGRKGKGDNCRLGYNSYSWCLYGEKDKTEAWHQKEAVSVSGSPKQVGVYVNFDDGIVSFYSVHENSVSLLHEFQHNFTQPLLPALAVSKMSLSFC